MHMQFYFEDVKETDRLGDTVVDGKIILKMDLKEAGCV